MPPQVCPNCGTPVPPDANVCPECGSDEETGWSEEAYQPSPDVPDEDFDYEEFSKREFGSKDPVPHGIPVFWWLVAVGLLGAILYVWLK